MTFNPQPKHKPTRLSPARRRDLKDTLYYDRAMGLCESCGRYVPLSGSVFEAAHLSHIKSVGSGGDDSEENCLIECYDCHIIKRHGLKWTRGE